MKQQFQTVYSYIWDKTAQQVDENLLLLPFIPTLSF